MTTENNPYCHCVINSDCIISNCQCNDQCIKYKDFKLTSYTQYVTISPNPKDYINIKKLVRDWVDKLFKLSKQLDTFIFVFEMDGSRPHIHGIVNVKSGRLYGFTNVIYKWSRYNNAKIHKQFSKGMHYLFKEWQSTNDLLGISIIDKDNIRHVYEMTVPSASELLDDMLELAEEKMESRKSDHQLVTLPPYKPQPPYIYEPAEQQ